MLLLKRIIVAIYAMLKTLLLLLFWPNYAKKQFWSSTQKRFDTSKRKDS